eukprot:4610368-Amphidinium_carterae.1
MVTSITEDDISAMAPGPMDTVQEVDTRPPNDPINPLEYDSDEVSSDSTPSTIDRDIRDNMEILMWNQLVTAQCSPDVPNKLHDSWIILSTKEEQSMRSTKLMREQLIQFD